MPVLEPAAPTWWRGGQHLAARLFRPSALVQLLAPLALAALWSYGLGGRLFGTLDALAVCVGVILLGFGSANVIHVLARYRDRRFAGQSVANALSLALGRRGRATLAATLATLVSSMSLVIADLGAFRELGTLSGGGLWLIFLAYALVWPALEPRASVRVHAQGQERIPRIVDRMLAGAPWVFWAGMLVAFALSVRAPEVHMTAFEHTPRSMGLALLGVGLALGLVLDSVRLVALVAAPVLLSLAMLFGLLAGLGIELNYLNVIMLPVLIGTGVHTAAHLLVRVDAGVPLRTAVWRRGRVISSRLIMTALGFAALLPAGHPGLRSVAQVAVLGLVLNLWLGVVLLPAFLAMFTAVGGAVRLRPPQPAIAEPAAGARGPGLVASAAAHVATCLRAGHARWAPGSLGALLALPVAWLMRELTGSQHALWIAGLTLATTLAVQSYLAGRTHDPQEVVVDEWIGCLISLAFVPFSAGWVVAAYLLFRLFDILKPGPIRWLDSRLGGGVGVMADDVAAGLAAGGVLMLARLAVLG
jgi:phosphatidylglycerophosphatase A